MGKVCAGFHDCADLGDCGACGMFCCVAFYLFAHIGVDHGFGIAGLDHHDIAVESCNIKERSVDGVADHSSRSRLLFFL